ncbi:MAG: DUF305 domain-containing protein [Leptolyngbyaceae cyanobacterium bins.302]|nr:DUF305 domain-containing protein [Leptolyngbyaceae cyanobacterium bins.302]
MPLKFFTKPGLIALALGAIATTSVLNACSSSAQNQAQAPNATATDAGSKQMDHGNMGGMNHGGMDHSRMDLGPADAEFDLRFIDSMIPHHEGAVVMAKAAQQQSKRPEIQKLAADIIKAQDKEIAQMQQWRTAWYPKAPSTPVAWHAKMGHSMAMSADQIKAMRMDMDLGAADADFDKRFIDAMIPHHEGAVVMANDAWQKSKRPEIQKLAQEIIGSQKNEIEQMQQWRKAWYGRS